MRFVRLILGDPDPRSQQEIERDIDDELEFHLERLEAEERAAGKPPDAARLEAQRRFGSLDHYRKLCLNLNLKERIMLQRINLALLVLVALGLGLTAWQSWAAQSRTANAVEGLTKQLAAMSANQATSQPQKREPSAASQAKGTSQDPPSQTIFISTWTSDTLTRAGAFVLPTDAKEASLRNMLILAGWDPSVPIDVQLRVRNEFGSPATKRVVIWKELNDPLQPDTSLAGYSEVFVQRVSLAADTTTSSPAATQPSPTPSASIVRTPATPDEHGKIADLGFNARVLSNFNTLRDECYREYDRVSTEAGLTLLASRTETVLVVGAVERPGVYLLDTVRKSGENVTELDVLLAAGASRDTTWYVIFNRVRPEYGTERGKLSASLYRRQPVFVKSDTIIVAYERPDVAPRFSLMRLKPFKGSFGVVTSFTPEAAREWDRWDNYTDFLEKPEKIEGRDDLTALSITDHNLIRNAVDIDDPIGKRRLIGGLTADSQVNAELREILNHQQASSKEMEHFQTSMVKEDDEHSVNPGAVRTTPAFLRVRVYDRLAKKVEPIVELPYDEALKSDAQVPDGAYIEIKQVFK